MQRKLLHLKYTYYESNIYRIRVVYICTFTASFSTVTKMFPSEDTDFPCYTLQYEYTLVIHLFVTYIKIFTLKAFYMNKLNYKTEIIIPSKEHK